MFHGSYLYPPFRIQQDVGVFYSFTPIVPGIRKLINSWERKTFDPVINLSTVHSILSQRAFFQELHSFKEQQSWENWTGFYFQSDCIPIRWIGYALCLFNY